MVHDFEHELRKALGILDLPLTKLALLCKVLKVPMVCQDSHWCFSISEEVVPMFQALNGSQQLHVMYVVVPFWCH